MKISIIAPSIFGKGCITEPHVVKQIWMDVLGELVIPRSKEGWIEAGRELRQSIEQDNLVTTFEVTDATCVVPLLLFALDRFIRRRNPITEYIGRRYRGQTVEFCDRKHIEVRHRAIIATALSQVIKDQPMFTLMNREGEAFQFPLSTDFELMKTWDELEPVTLEELARTLRVPAKLMGDVKSHNLATALTAGKTFAMSMGATVEQPKCKLCDPIKPILTTVTEQPGDVERAVAEGVFVPGNSTFTLTNPPKKIGPFPMREDKPVQTIRKTITESLNRVKKTHCRHCEEEIFWVKLPDGRNFLADNFKPRRELDDIDALGYVRAGANHIVCVPHYCPALAERVPWPKGKRPAHPLKERLWMLLVQAGVQGGAATQLISTAFKPEVMIPVDRLEGTAQGDALEEAKKAFEKAEADSKNTVVLPAVEVQKAPVREWGIIREMARLLRETADHGSELNLEDRKRLNATADLAESAVGERTALVVMDDKLRAELATIKEDFDAMREAWNKPSPPCGQAAIPVVPVPDSKAADS
jgi:hypothetical protein